MDSNALAEYAFLLILFYLVPFLAIKLIFIDTELNRFLTSVSKMVLFIPVLNLIWVVSVVIWYMFVFFFKMTYIVYLFKEVINTFNEGLEEFKLLMSERKYKTRHQKITGITKEWYEFWK